MASPKTFPVLSAKVLSGDFLTFLQAEIGITVLRPNLISFLLGNGANKLPIVPAGKVARNKVWQASHVAESFTYADESTRSRQAGGSQVETVRAAIVKIADGYDDYNDSGDLFPRDALKLTGGENGTVNIWRVR